MNRLILHIRSGFTVGGPEKLILSGIQQLKESGYDFVIASFALPNVPNRFLEEAQSQNISTEVIAVSGSFDFSSVKQLRKLFSRIRPSIIVAHDYRAIILSLIARRGFSIPLISVAHGWTGQSQRVKIYEFIERFAFKLADRVVAVSEPKLRELQKQGLAFPKLALIENGVALPEPDGASDTDLREQLGIERSEILIGAVGRLSIEKGHKFFLDTAARLRRSHPEAKYVLVGDGPLRAELQRLAIHLGIQDIFFFVGWISDMEAVYRSLDIFMLPSLTEGLPMALLEAMSYGIPSIATTVGGVPNVIETNVSGLLATPGNSDSLTLALRKLLVDGSLRHRIKAASRKTICERYSLARYASDFKQLYDETQESVC